MPNISNTLIKGEAPPKIHAPLVKISFGVVEHSQPISLNSISASFLPIFLESCVLVRGGSQASIATELGGGLSSTNYSLHVPFFHHSGVGSSFLQTKDLNFPSHLEVWSSERS